jgi:hypothetical protein
VPEVEERTHPTHPLVVGPALEIEPHASTLGLRCAGYGCRCSVACESYQCSVTCLT